MKDNDQITAANDRPSIRVPEFANGGIFREIYPTEFWDGRISRLPELPPLVDPSTGEVKYASICFSRSGDAWRAYPDDPIPSSVKDRD